MVGCVAVPAVPLTKCLSRLCHMRYRLKANIQPANSSMCLQLLDLTKWESGKMLHGTVAARRTSSCMERWVAACCRQLVSSDRFSFVKLMRTRYVGGAKGEEKTVWIHLPRFSATNSNLLEPIRSQYSRDARRVI